MNIVDLKAAIERIVMLDWETIPQRKQEMNGMLEIMKNSLRIVIALVIFCVLIVDTLLVNVAGNSLSLPSKTGETAIREIVNRVQREKRQSYAYAVKDAPDANGRRVKRQFFPRRFGPFLPAQQSGGFYGPFGYPYGPLFPTFPYSPYTQNFRSRGSSQRNSPDTFIEYDCDY
ncbi:hypothetical protein KIN20_030930 [Parelaphostrongylus tenuis]|uniref:Uncharacterized protein n=1 Tax=Parelaphostrongylus tenuis TaxID=148309 RepID=A0AAD5R4V0_PARTN|nr:hypothetical protein KIN20_030930 [Parelaphostrongylus tenuis]